MIKKNPIKLISFFSVLIVPLLVTGTLIPDLILSLLSVWFLYYSIKNKIFYIYNNFYFYSFIGFWITCVMSSLLSDNILMSLKSSLFYIRIGIFSLLISYLIDQNKKILDYFYYFFLFTFSCLIIDGYFQYFTKFNIFGYKIYAMRVSSFFGDELILGSFLSRLFPLCVALFIIRTDKKKWEFYYFPVFTILISILIFMSGERASLFFHFLSCTFLVFFMSRYKLMRLSIYLTIIMSFIFFVTVDNIYKKRFIESVIESTGLKKDKFYIFTAGHDSLYRTSWNMFLDKPILGHGPKLYRIKCNDTKYAEGVSPCYPHPHNFYMQLLAETGLVGFSFLAGLFFYFIYLIARHCLNYFSNKNPYLSDYQLCLLAGLLITIWPFTSNGSFFTNQLMLFYGFQIGFFRKNI